ncbi:putative groupII intron reverse transcriptase /maturase (mitochondrion) [Bryopsis sp. KO-2023]|nr:putative groupII intron reverse transcriptase /maturase [Bryopsis sp. KO-2023]
MALVVPFKAVPDRTKRTYRPVTLRNWAGAPPACRGGSAIFASTGNTRPVSDTCISIVSGGGNGGNHRGKRPPTRGPISLARDKNVCEALEDLRTERFYFMPEGSEPSKSWRGWGSRSARQALRPLGSRYPPEGGVQRDQMILEAIRIILETVYEPVFLDSSHGLRPLRSCHTALRKIRTSSRSHHWALTSCLFRPPGGSRQWRGQGGGRMVTTLDHHVLIHLLEKKIGDKRFLRLIWKALRAGYAELDDQYPWTPPPARIPAVGTRRWSAIGRQPPRQRRGSLPSLLANIYLHELDKWMQKITQQFDCEWRLRDPVGLARRCAPYSERGISAASARAMLYVRYADSFIVTFLAPKKEVHTFQAVLRVFLQERLKLTLYDPNMTNLGQHKTLFLGTWICVSPVMGYSIKRGSGKFQLVTSKSAFRPHIFYPLRGSANFLKRGTTAIASSQPKKTKLHSKTVGLLCAERLCPNASGSGKNTKAARADPGGEHLPEYELCKTAGIMSPISATGAQANRPYGKQKGGPISTDLGRAPPGLHPRSVTAVASSTWKARSLLANAIDIYGRSAQASRATAHFVGRARNWPPGQPGLGQDNMRPPQIKTNVRLRAPIERLVNQLADLKMCSRGGQRSKPVLFLISSSHNAIIKYYNWVMRGLTNYYSFVDNWSRFTKMLRLILKTSCSRTLAAKLKRITAAKIYKEFGNECATKIRVPVYHGKFKMEQLTKEERTIIRSRLTKSLEILRNTNWPRCPPRNGGQGAKNKIRLEERALIERLYVPKVAYFSGLQCLEIRGEHLVYCTRAVTTQEGKEVQRKLGLLPPAANYWGFSSMTNAQPLLLPTTCVLRAIQRGSRLGGNQCFFINTSSECSGPAEINYIRTVSPPNKWLVWGPRIVPNRRTYKGQQWLSRTRLPWGRGSPIEPQVIAPRRGSLAQIRIWSYFGTEPLEISRFWSPIWPLDPRQITLCKYHSLGF